MPHRPFSSSVKVSGKIDFGLASVARALVTALAVVAVVAGQAVFSQVADRPRSMTVLDLPLLQVKTQHSIPLQDALPELGNSIREGFVLFGLEQNLSEGSGPVVDLNVEKGATVGTALRGILEQLPMYELEVVSNHLVNIRPRGAKEDSKNMLNLRVATFDVISKPAYFLLGSPRRAIADLDKALQPKSEPGTQVVTLFAGAGSQGGPAVTLHLKDVTVRQILNAVSEATEPFFEQGDPGKAPSGWMYTFDPHPPKGNPQHSWRRLFGLPVGWRVVPETKKKAEKQ